MIMSIPGVPKFQQRKEDFITVGTYVQQGKTFNNQFVHIWTKMWKMYILGYLGAQWCSKMTKSYLYY